MLLSHQGSLHTILDLKPKDQEAHTTRMAFKSLKTHSFAINSGIFYPLQRHMQEAHDKTVYPSPSILRPHLLKCSLPPGKNGHFFLVDSVIPYSDSTDLFFIHYSLSYSIKYFFDHPLFTRHCTRCCGKFEDDSHKAPASISLQSSRLIMSVPT